MNDHPYTVMNIPERRPCHLASYSLNLQTILYRMTELISNHSA